MKKKLFIIVAIISIIVGIFVIKNQIQNKYEYKIDKVNEFNYFIYRSEDNYGVIDKEGNIVVNAKYKDIIIPNPEKDVFICYKEDKAEVLNASSKVMFSEYEEVLPIKLKSIASALSYEKSTLIYKKDGLYGLINFNGKTVTKNIYEKIENLQPTEGKFIVSKDGKYGVIDIKGNKLVNIEYDNIKSDGYYTKEDGYKDSGFIISKKEEDGFKYGYINSTGKQVLNNKYNELIRIQKEDNNIYLVASENGKYGLYKNTKQIIKNEYQGITYDENLDILIIKKNKKYGASNLEGEIIIDIQNDELESRGIYIYAKNANDNKVYDVEGNIINISYNRSIYETENSDYRISTLLNNNITYYGIIDKDGKKLVDEIYRYIEYIFDNYFIVANNDGNLGIINNNGKEILEAKYSSMQKIKGKNIIQAKEIGGDETEFYSKNIEKIDALLNPIIRSQEDYIVVSDEQKMVYMDNDGKIIEDTSKLKNTSFPEKIGEYKKKQITIENVYYTKE